MQFKQTFDLHGDIAGQRAHPNGTPHSYPIIGSPDLRKQFATSIDDKGMTFEVGRAADHAEGLHDPLDLVETTEITAYRGQYGEPDLACRLLTLFRVEVLTDATDDQGSIVAYGTMTGYI